MTLHKWSGLGDGRTVKLENLSSDDYYAAAFECIRHTTSWSMFDKLEGLMRSIKGNDSVFGGCQIVVVGDFLQLPPVNKSTALRCGGWGWVWGGGDSWAVYSVRAWWSIMTEQGRTRRKLPRPPGSHVFQRTGTSFELDQGIIGTNLLTKFHEDCTRNVATRVFTT
ncbi:hypothetical protein DPMN_008393 [Dreissena polymorpha]|uniref:ATP-dependent DNA helicase n=1 Tax=Dreissena polymorpha TaxID=45954 RepID=A0A9D4RZ41_DREPO|nr:hypothetical protein DPMN_008393 [Dreissena polymorpha]